MVRKNMIRNVKKLAVVMLSGVLAVGYMVIPAWADNRKSGNLNGTACEGSLDYNYDSAGNCIGAIAKTTYSAAADITAEVWVYYKFGDYKKHEYGKGTSTGGGVSAKATNNDLGNVKGAKGHHLVKTGPYSWDEYTSLGENW